MGPSLSVSSPHAASSGSRKGPAELHHGSGALPPKRMELIDRVLQDVLDNMFGD